MTENNYVRNNKTPRSENCLMHFEPFSVNLPKRHAAKTKTGSRKMRLVLSQFSLYERIVWVA